MSVGLLDASRYRLPRLRGHGHCVGLGRQVHLDREWLRVQASIGGGGEREGDGVRAGGVHPQVRLEALSFVLVDRAHAGLPQVGTMGLHDTQNLPEGLRPHGQAAGPFPDLVEVGPEPDPLCHGLLQFRGEPRNAPARICLGARHRPSTGGFARGNQAILGLEELQALPLKPAGPAPGPEDEQLQPRLQPVEQLRRPADLLFGLLVRIGACMVHRVIAQLVSALEHRPLPDRLVPRVVIGSGVHQEGADQVVFVQRRHGLLDVTGIRVIETQAHSCLLAAVPAADARARRSQATGERQPFQPPKQGRT